MHKFFSICALICIAGMLTLLGGCMTRDGVLKQQEPGSIKIIETDGVAALIFLDEQPVGKSSDGSFTLNPVSSGKHEITLFAEGFELGKTEVIVIEGTENTVQFTMNSSESGTISVKSSAGAMVNLAGLNFGNIDETGLFEIKGFPVGDFSLTVNAGSLNVDSMITISSGETVTINAILTLKQQVLVEHISNVSCEYCPEYAEIMYHVLDSMGWKNVIKISSNANWPAADDPLYGFNPQPQKERVMQYGPKVNYALPIFVVNGVTIQHKSSTELFHSLFVEALNRELSKEAQFNIALEKESVKIVNLTDSTITGTIQVELVQNNVSFETAPGNNGEKEFRNVFRRRLVQEKGVTFAPGDTIIREFTTDLSELSASGLSIVGFIQNGTSLEVYQTATIAY